MKTNEPLKIFLGIMLAWLCLSCQSLTAQNIKNEASQYLTWESFDSKFVLPRHIEIRLPPNYDSNKTYPVLYMHDGQNVFDSENSHWGKSWELGKTLDSLDQNHPLSQIIVVAPWSTERRFLEYCPAKPAEAIPVDSLKKWRHQNTDLSLQSDYYLRFLVEELKPAVDNAFSTKADRAHTFIAGSSMGGLISWYAVSEYPMVFGGAACLSPHWPLRLDSDSKWFTNAALDYLSKQSLNSETLPKLYFDCGTATLDTPYRFHQKRIDSLYLSTGFYNEKNFKSLVFEGAEHDENAWKPRIAPALGFIMGINQQ